MITREFETPSGKFRQWMDTGTIECVNDGRWTSIPEPAQQEIIRLRNLYEPEGRRHGKQQRIADVKRLVNAGLTYREVARAVGYKSASAIHRIVRQGTREPSI